MIEEATMTATVVTAQRKTKCLIQRNYRGFSLHQTRVRNSLRIARCTVNELKSSTPLNLCRKRTKLSKLKLEEDRPKPADRLPEQNPKKHHAVRPYLGNPLRPLARKVCPCENQKSRCRPRQDEGPSHQMKKSACAPTLFPSAAVDSRCPATQTQTGLRPNDNSSPNQARAEPILTPG